jgi:DNA-binding NtrC family response regulator
MNILVVDDEAVLVESIKIGLQSKGHQVIAANCGQEALDYLFEGGQRIDMVITDYLMPGMTGIDLLVAIRQRAPTLPVVLMTAYGETKLVIEALKNKCDGFLEKPFTLDHLIQEIEAVNAGRLHRKTP